MIWMALIPAWLKRAVAGLLAGAAIIGGAFLAGRRNARQAAKIKALEAKDKARTTREAIEDEIHNDTDLADRARRAGIVRPGDE